MTHNDFATTRQIADELKRAPETLIRWRRMRIGPPYIRLQGRVLYDRNEVRQWIAEQAVRPVAA